MHVKRGDQVIIIAGNDKGRTGQVTQVDVERGRVVVEGINMRVRHKKPTQQNPQGERVELEASLHASNVMLLDAKTGKGTRKRPTEA
ncbi:MAG: 50S ribosomal protein L24 [Planctomycetes bacterium]|nr:50S ribosomal protein L24 [Planctomycetota bacterium]MCB9910374.1 50S ribosomal protein L24 [Planctomycetota bacterium]MCB9912015.1 50S ribosomal protein L24 [Planctomycetota bacterium]HPF14235.1 50S ribosomal protein L24 [Planctomycetota bacterium]HRV80555.1 50S ribosomal protein L24 [Planctomycetota bacterium]